MASPHVIDVKATTFRADVQERSLQTPVLIDFWAEWCGPCKTLSPLLEKLADEYGGAFVLGKVDTEAEPELAQAFQVRGIPFLVLFAGGQPVDAAQGALPEPELRSLLSRHGITPAAAGGEAPEEPDPDSAEAKLAAARQAIRARDFAAAANTLDGIGDDADCVDDRDRLRDALGAIDAPIDPATPVAATLARGREAMLVGAWEQAMELLLEAAMQDKAAAGGLVRRAMLLCFAAIGEDTDLAADNRRRLATLMY